MSNPPTRRKNSSIQAWIDYSSHIDPHRSNFDPNPTALQPCTRDNLSVTNCTNVCNDISALFKPSLAQNIATCGIWAQYVASFPNASGYPVAFLEAGLQFDRGFARSVGDTIGTCLGAVDASLHMDTSSPGTSSACIKSSIFGSPVHLRDDVFSSDSVAGVGPCVEALCAPRELNPDIGGIGVFSSFLMQIILAIVAFVALHTLQFWPTRAPKRREHHVQTLVAALVEFQKAQCYFAGAIQIAAIAFARQVLRFGNEVHTVNGDATSAGSLFTVSGNGFAPEIFVLTCIALHGRQSWYLTLLSLCSVALSTLTLIFALVIWSPMFKEYLHGGPRPTEYSRFIPSCLQNYTSFSTICGPKTSIFDIGFEPEARLKNAVWTWVMWANSFAWASYCVVLMVQNRHKPDLVKGPKSRVWYTVFIISWTITFAYQIYDYSLYFFQAQVPMSWSFGQIVAITIWAPCLVEYLYLEIHGMANGSQYRLRAPLTVTAKSAHSSTIVVSNEHSPEPDEYSLLDHVNLNLGQSEASRRIST